MEARVFSKKCANCRERAVELTPIDYTVEVAHDGRTDTVTVPGLLMPQCQKCGHRVVDAYVEDQVNAAFRQEAGLLTPEQIRHHRTLLGLKQQEMADLLGVAMSTLSRWETGGQIQQRSLDKFMRLFFKLPAAREMLENNENLGFVELAAHG